MTRLLNGNCDQVTSGGQTTTLSYDYEDRLTGITYPSSSTNSFKYNGLGLRVQKVDSGGTTNYATDGAEVASPVLADTNATYTPGLSERRGTTSKFYHSDALGSTRGITDVSQSATDGILYDAFGQTVSRTGTTPTPFGFVGAGQYQTDADSGLMLLGHRYYDPSTGRFITSDPAQAGENWYAYCGNNPLRLIDPLGLDGKGLLPDDPDGNPRHPPGYDDDWNHGTDGRGGYVEDPNTGRKFWPHPEDKGHWPHYDWQDQDGKVGRWPGKSLKPWPGQKKPPYGDQSATDPWKRIPVPLPSDPYKNTEWWQNVNWPGVGADVGIGVGAGIIILNPELWPTLPLLGAKWATAH